MTKRAIAALKWWCKANLFCISILLLLSGSASAQWMVGASANTLFPVESNNEYNIGTIWSSGLSIELGHKYSFGWLFLEGSWINHKLIYNQTYPAHFQTTNGQSSVYFTAVGSYGGITFDAGGYSTQGYTAYFASGPQYFLSASYCYPFNSYIMLGPVIGIGLQKEVAVTAANVYDPYLERYSLPIYGPPNNSASRTEAVGNFGGEVNISIGVTFMLEYATKTGAGLGFAVPF